MGSVEEALCAKEALDDSVAPLRIFPPLRVQFARSGVKEPQPPPDEENIDEEDKKNAGPSGFLFEQPLRKEEKEQFRFCFNLIKRSTTKPLPPVPGIRA